MNPFIVSGFAGAGYFCDRKSELAKLKEAFRNGRNVTLYSLRRMGKSSLVKYLFSSLGKEADCIYIDLFPAASLQDLTQLLANAVTRHFGFTVKTFPKKIAALLRAVNASLSVDPYTGKPEIKFGIGDARGKQENLEGILSYLEKSGKKVLIAFDEFQSILRFPEKNTESMLRSLFQNCRNINFIFCGSSRGMMEAIFNDAAGPFYRSTQHLYLGEISREDYKSFIAGKFKAGGMKIEEKQAEFVLDTCRCHTYYVQYFCNRLYSKRFRGSDKMLYDTLDEILLENQPVYNNYRNLLTDTQWRLVKAVAKEGSVEKPLAAEFVNKYGLKSPSSIQRALASLLEKEILLNINGKYLVYDVFFSLWLKKY